MSDAFFRPGEGDTFEATEHTRGPWSHAHQHGGPPSALALRAMETVAASLGTPIPMRVTVELLRPVPIGRLTVVAEATPEGRGVRRVHARVLAEGQEVLRVLGLFGNPRPVEIEVAPPVTAPTPPTALPDVVLPFFRSAVGYHTGMELRYARGALGDARVFAWMRMRIPLVAGESPSPAQRVMIAADSGNGVTAAIDWSTHTFLNPDLTVAFFRMPAGEWVGLDAEMRTDPNGLGIASTELWDERGPLGRGTQTLLIRKLG